MSLPTSPDSPVLLEKLSLLTLEEKVSLLTGADMWSTTAIPKIGLRRIVVSDGPSGVRGETWDEHSPSLNLPSASSLSSTWNLSAAFKAGVCVAGEARRKSVDVVLGPTINLHRSPLGGRHFEAFSEDPILTSEIASALIEGIQSQGVGGCLKHYVANDFEEDRNTANVEVSDRALRELYLLAFEKAVVEARSWVVMSSYNSINGVTSSENDLLETPLNSEWGFDGVVVSDWFASHSINSARASQDLLMPGPFGPWGQALVDAVRQGEIDESVVDRKVLRLLLLASRVGALDGVDYTAPPLVQVDNLTVARELAVEGSVLLKNDGNLLPLSADVQRIAVIGDNALRARTQGGGSATVVPESIVTPLDAITARYPQAHVSYAMGAIVHEGVVEFDAGSIRNPLTGEQGARVSYLDFDDQIIREEDRFSATIMILDLGDQRQNTKTFRWEAQWTADVSGEILLGLTGIGEGRIFIDEELIGTTSTKLTSKDPGGAIFSTPSASVPAVVMADRTYSLRCEIDLDPEQPFMTAVCGITSFTANPQSLIDEAVSSAREADVAIVVVGTNAAVESEGFDRSSLALPGLQDELVSQVTKANHNTIVVVNSGSPVLMPWRNEVSTILVTYFAGQEFGNALVDILSGEGEPGGRLPTTWPSTESDVPILDTSPKNGVVRYDEGIHIGYKAWLKNNTAPAFCFGHGLGYTSWHVGIPAISEEHNGAKIELNLTNTGNRAGKQVVQVYASRSETAIDRPARWLVGFASVWVEPGFSEQVCISVPLRAFAHWDGHWNYEPGEFTLHVGTSLENEAHRLSFFL
ncbi:beta-glucosidase family protein [Aurantimicrobium minutum]|uniref:beta-glucosidase family protein n=1 Tax=Aurantimicrobium minutum TaxID=708131 RepID=UPI002474F30E|nr:glycoside hydrolase family 3 C-terminal domain-containing protein [Aurantimicrobium minutum]MDH6422395.1 beta-glucosidase [Aurantimicrobium minutum]